MAKNLALNSRKWHKKNLIGENGGERKINPSANPEDPMKNYKATKPAMLGHHWHASETSFMFCLFIPDQSL